MVVERQKMLSFVSGTLFGVFFICMIVEEFKR
jgi:hypothetical protein